MAYYWGAVAVFAVIALGLLIWYATRAGKAEGTTAISQQGETEAQDTTRVTQAMAQAQTDKPASEADAIARLNAGDA